MDQDEMQAWPLQRNWNAVCWDALQNKQNYAWHIGLLHKSDNRCLFLSVHPTGSIHYFKCNNIQNKHTQTSDVSNFSSRHKLPSVMKSATKTSRLLAWRLVNVSRSMTSHYLHLTLKKRGGRLTFVFVLCWEPLLPSQIGLLQSAN
jgi:hypothetical protein